MATLSKTNLKSFIKMRIPLSPSFEKKVVDDGDKSGIMSDGLHLDYVTSTVMQD